MSDANTPAPLPPPCPFCEGQPQIILDPSWGGVCEASGKDRLASCQNRTCGIYSVEMPLSQWARRPSSTGDAGPVSPGVPDGLREAAIATCAAFHDTAHIGKSGSAWIDNLRDKINAMGAALASGEKGGTP